MITGYRNLPKTKYGPCKMVNGLLYKNLDSNYIGRQYYTMWLYEKNPLYNLIVESCTGCDLYVTFGPNGKVIEGEIKRG